MSFPKNLIDKREIIFDIQGDFSSFCRIRFFYRNTPVGYCNLIKDGDSALLADIKIYNHSRPVARFIPFIKIGFNFRRHGLGTMLLKKAIKHCKDNNISKIVGQIQGDLEILIPWYRKFGFNINDKNELYLNLSNKINTE